MSMRSIVSTARRSFDTLLARLRRYGWQKNAIGAVLILMVVFGVSTFFGSSAAVVAPENAARLVEVKSVAELSSDQPTLSIVGIVQSKSEATVRAEKSGQVISVNRSLGDSVGAGTIVASIENGSESAAVLSAQGSVDAAQAALSKVSGGSREEQKAILQASLETSQSGYASAQSSAVNALLSAYSTLDSAVRGTGDGMFSNPDTSNPYFNVSNPDSQLTTNINNTRLSMGPILSRETAASKLLTNDSDLNAELDKAEIEVRSARAFFDLIIRALNAAVPSGNTSTANIATFQANAIAARASLNASLSSISGAKENLSAKNQGVTIAQKSLEQGVTGGQPEDVAAAQAGLKQAQGALAAARANLEKTYIRAPISGTINSFSLKRGDYVQQTSPVLTVANNGALEIVAYVTENDARDIAAGSKVMIEKDVPGVITRVAPALDPVTKKIEVRIGVSSGDVSLVNGQSVIVSINRVNATISSHITKITVPISAIKIGSDNTVVFTLGADMKLVAHPVTVGALLGDRVAIASGVTPDMEIVTDARGLREGQVVTTK